MDRTRGALVRLNRLNRTGVFLATVAVVIAGLLLPGIAGAVPLIALAGALVGLLTLTWPYQNRRTRVLRVAVLAFLFVAAVVKLVG
jgi:hypothetical protein